MKKVYKSKIDLWLIVFIVLTIGGIVYPITIYGYSIVEIIIIIITAVLYLIPLFSIKYIIDDEYLTVKFLYLFSAKIKIDDIVSIKPTRTLLSAPAASIDRLEISFKNESVVISPRNKQEFIQTLQELCSHEIEIKD